MMRWSGALSCDCNFLLQRHFSFAREALEEKWDPISVRAGMAFLQAGRRVTFHVK